MAVVGRRANLGGRKPDPSKDRAILAAARTSFYERGFSASTMEDIAQRAGVSKVTVYKRFTDKETLFEAFVTTEVEAIERAILQASPSDGGLDEELNAYGIVLLRFLFAPEQVALERFLSHELAQMPGLSRRFYEAGPGYCLSWLADMLSDAQARGEIALDDPALAAADLIALWRGFSETEFRFGVASVPDDSTIRSKVERGTRLFLRIVRPKD